MGLGPVKSKDFDGANVLGPVIVTADEIADINQLTLTTRLNGEIKQQGSTRDLIFPIAHLLRYITAAMTLEPGDLIPTGTPAGVGPVNPGDRIQVEIDGLGVLENTFQPE